MTKEKVSIDGFMNLMSRLYCLLISLDMRKNHVNRTAEIKKSIMEQIGEYSLLRKYEDLFFRESKLQHISWFQNNSADNEICIDISFTYEMGGKQFIYEQDFILNDFTPKFLVELKESTKNMTPSYIGMHLAKEDLAYEEFRKIKATYNWKEL